ncbi:hypothetical protein BHM03_00048191 [Ensete ventricosum]|nr:hypothetical protein BHM03_00048191 [Ensete ventricosum]
MSCFRLGKGCRSYYLIARSGSRVCGAPSNSKGWKAQFLFVSGFRGWGFNLKWYESPGDEEGVVTWDSHPETSRPTTEPAVKKLVSVKVLPPLKRLKKLGDSLKDKGVARPRSIRDLCRVKAWVPDEPYMAREIVELPELVGDSPLKVRWASLAPRHKVWADGADAQVDVQKLKDESGSVAIAAAEVGTMRRLQRWTRSNARKPRPSRRIPLGGVGGAEEGREGPCRRAEHGPEKARATIAHYKESLGFKSSLEKMGRVSYEFGYKIALTRFRTKHPGLEVEEDPYATLPEDNDVPMDVEVPFDGSDPPTM